MVILVQNLNGSPVYPGSQVQIGLWFWALQVACVPQTPGQGSTHFWLTQALSVGHSGLMEHSGLHSMYGFPNISGKHVQDAAPFRSLHSALIPQGDGRHGSIISGLGLVAGIKWLKWKLSYNLILTCWPNTSRERIPNISLVTNADRNMIPNSAVCIDTTQTRTGVLAFSANASKCRGTIRIDNTFWSAVRRGTNHFW